MHGEGISYAYGFWSLVIANAGLFLIMIGMLIQWPTIITALMFPVLIFVYYGLSKMEEGEMIATFGEEYKQYMEKVPMFIPRLKRSDKFIRTHKRMV